MCVGLLADLLPAKPAGIPDTLASGWPRTLTREMLSDAGSFGPAILLCLILLLYHRVAKTLVLLLFALSPSVVTLWCWDQVMTANRAPAEPRPSASAFQGEVDNQIRPCPGLPHRQILFSGQIHSVLGTKIVQKARTPSCVTDNYRSGTPETSEHPPCTDRG